MPLSPKKPGSELAEMKRELSGLRQENNKLQEELKVLITERLDDANDEVRRMYETLQLNLHEERNAKDEEMIIAEYIIWCFYSLGLENSHKYIFSIYKNV